MSGTFLVSRGVLVTDVSTTALNPTNAQLAVANNLRIASLSIAAYDYLITLPAELRVYKSSNRRSLGFILFILIRYTSMILMITSNFGFFYHHFTPKACSHYCFVAPVFKVIQIMVSQAILGIRTYNIAQRNIRIGRIIILAYSVGSVFLWFTALYGRQAEMTDGNCMPGSAHPNQAISAWLFYLIAMLYDILVLFISTYRLLKLRDFSVSSASSRLLNILLYDGLGYFVALTTTNLVNILLYRGVRGAIQSSASSLEYAVIWIMSQRIIFHLSEEKVKQASLVVSQLQLPRSNQNPCSLQKPPSRNGINDNPTKEIENNYNTALSDYNAGVRVIIRDRDAKPLYEESGSTAERDIYPPPISVQVWDKTTGKGSEV